ncbi:MAG: hypothetical protein JWO20_1542 [Candidatus Angelobacter sp.]|jgi:glycosyltransferase involved in cell wall biosynthesis|nr:hypothetical protein [Candidatus Angelobacter sp.]
MICPSLSELPPPPAGKSGWPWTEGADPSQPSASAPRISIVTPSYNQGQFLEETIRSVLLQGYSNLEYIIIDGGSSDQSCAIIKKYEPWISYWVSESDRGQAHALNKGIAKITGKLFGWINSDDLLVPGALDLLGRNHQQFPGHILAGDVVVFQDGSGAEEFCPQHGLEFRNCVEYWRPERSWAQPGVFLPSELMSQVGKLDETLHYCFDHDLLCRALPLAEVKTLNSTVARYRHHSTSKTVSKLDFFHLEVVKVTRKYWSSLPQMDTSAARRHCVSLLIQTGLNRTVAGKSASMFFWDAIKIHPFWSLYSTGGWMVRRLLNTPPTPKQ